MKINYLISDSNNTRYTLYRDWLELANYIENLNLISSSTLSSGFKTVYKQLVFQSCQP